MDKVARLKQKMQASWLMATIFVGFGAGWRMGTHEEILVMLWDMFPIYFIILLYGSGKQAIKELETRAALPADSTTAPEPMAAPVSPDSTPPEDE